MDEKQIIQDFPIFHQPDKRKNTLLSGFGSHDTEAFIRSRSNGHLL